MAMQTFEITMTPFRKKEVKFTVDVYHRSDSVIRFRLTGGEKIMNLEKRLLEKTQPWKILSTNFEMEQKGEVAERNLSRVFELIDLELSNKPSKISYLQRKKD